MKLLMVLFFPLLLNCQIQKELSQQEVDNSARAWCKKARMALAQMSNGSNEINGAQKEYIEKELTYARDLQELHKDKWNNALENLMKKKFSSRKAIIVKQWYIAYQDIKADYYIKAGYAMVKGGRTNYEKNGHRIAEGYCIKRIPTNVSLTDDQKALFLIAFNSTSVATLKSVDSNFPCAQIMRPCGFGSIHEIAMLF